MSPLGDPQLAMTVANPRTPLRRLVFIALVAALGIGLLVIASAARARIRTMPVYEPPVLAGQPVACTAGFYARREANLKAFILEQTDKAIRTTDHERRLMAGEDTAHPMVPGADFGAEE